MDGPDDPTGPPAFDEPFDADDVEQRVYGAVLQTREPATAAEVAERADCDAKSARKYLTWFAELGVVTEYEGRPATYQRNDAYFEWRRVHELASAHSLEELQREVTERTERIEAYREAYDAASPGAVDVLAVDDERVDDVYEELGDWATTERERRLYERARQQVADATVGTHP